MTLMGILKDIPHVNSATSIEKIEKGFSDDSKYVLDQTYLLRIFPRTDVDQRKAEFDVLKELGTYSAYVSEAIEFGVTDDYGYMILSYLPGVDAEVELRKLKPQEQYVAGCHAGKELKKMHALKAPAHFPSWYTQKKKKTEKYLENLSNIQIDESMRKLIEDYIADHIHLMQDRPNTFQHDDFHPSNLLIHKGKFAGIIDFQRMDWGDPIHDLTKLGFFSSRVSEDFTCGIVDGYHGDEGVNQEFWELYTLYSAIHIASALVWGKRRISNNFDLLLSYSLDVIRDHDNFNEVIPKWYRVR